MKKNVETQAKLDIALSDKTNSYTNIDKLKQELAAITIVKSQFFPFIINKLC